jgi:RNA polymerase sigma-70 factor (ECF subfamily)
MTFREDQFYINRILKGESSAYAALVDKHKEMVFTIAVKIVRNQQDAEEVAQDVFVKAFHALTTFKGDAKFSTWLYRIAYNTAISATRKKKPVFTVIDDKMIDNYTTDQVMQMVNERSESEQIEVMNRLMDNLPEEENLLLTLFYKKEKTIEEISGITGLSESNVKVKLYRIRKKMYLDLQQCFQKS